MPLHYLRHSSLNLAAWDACVGVSREALPYAFSWWLKAMAGRWDAVVEMDEASGAYRSVLPLPVKRRPWGREVYQPAFTQQLGLFTTAASQHRDVLDYLPLVPRGLARFYLQLNTVHELVAAPPGFELVQRRTYHLSLAPSYPTLLGRYAADYRRRLRQNQRLTPPVPVSETSSPDELVRLFQEHRGQQVRGVGLRQYRQLRRLWAELRSRGHGLILEAREPGTSQLLAGALFVRHANVLIYLFAAASPAGKKMAAPLLLLDHVVRRYAGTVGLVLDFEGGNIPSIARFFANFGAQPVFYPVLTQTKRPWYLQWMP